MLTWWAAGNAGQVALDGRHKWAVPYLIARVNDEYWHSCIFLAVLVWLSVFPAEEFGQNKFWYRNNLFILLFESPRLLVAWCW